MIIKDINESWPCPPNIYEIQKELDVKIENMIKTHSYIELIDNPILKKCNEKLYIDIEKTLSTVDEFIYDSSVLKDSDFYIIFKYILYFFITEDHMIHKDRIRFREVVKKINEIMNEIDLFPNRRFINEIFNSMITDGPLEIPKNTKTILLEKAFNMLRNSTDTLYSRKNYSLLFILCFTILLKYPEKKFSIELDKHGGCMRDLRNIIDLTNRTIYIGKLTPISIRHFVQRVGTLLDKVDFLNKRTSYRSIENMYFSIFLYISMYLLLLDKELGSGIIKT